MTSIIASKPSPNIANSKLFFGENFYLQSFFPQSVLRSVPPIWRRPYRLQYYTARVLTAVEGCQQPHLISSATVIFVRKYNERSSSLTEFFDICRLFNALERISLSYFGFKKRWPVFLRLNLSFSPRGGEEASICLLVVYSWVSKLEVATPWSSFEVFVEALTSFVGDWSSNSTISESLLGDSLLSISFVWFIDVCAVPRVLTCKNCLSAWLFHLLFYAHFCPRRLGIFPPGDGRGRRICFPLKISCFQSVFQLIRFARLISFHRTMHFLRRSWIQTFGSSTCFQVISVRSHIGHSATPRIFERTLPLPGPNLVFCTTLSIV